MAGSYRPKLIASFCGVLETSQQIGHCKMWYWLKESNIIVVLSRTTFMKEWYLFDRCVVVSLALLEKPTSIVAAKGIVYLGSDADIGVARNIIEVCVLGYIYNLTTYSEYFAIEYWNSEHNILHDTWDFIKVYCQVSWVIAMSKSPDKTVCILFLKSTVQMPFGYWH